MNLSRALHRLTANRPGRLIQIDGKPYLERYFVARLLGLTIYLHRFVGPDGDRHVHNHPWRLSLSIVLRGGYREARLVSFAPYQTREREVRWINLIRRSTFHRIVGATRPGDTWTLFIHTTRRLGAWGFLQKGDADHGQLISYQEYPTPTDPDWHLTAPLGRDMPREPIMEET
ncbi:MAG: hypothetical protein H6981_07105 [Gammaproteobacteria bacterium]|nr:hypothetical protein [Gammaproteobacteria bacterium]